VNFEITNSDSQEDNSENEYIQEQETNISNPQKRARKQLLTPRLAAALDKCKISERDCLHLIMAFMEAVSLDPSNYVINRTSIRNQRNIFRKKYTEKIKENFSKLNAQVITVHWDTKLLHDITGRPVERLSIIGTSTNIEQLLGVPEIPAATGNEVASAIYDTLEDWNLIENVQAFSFDTTASNTGRLKGACTILEQKLERDVLYFGCRHHVFEIILAAVFTKCKFTVSGPDIPLFKRFQASWSKINTQNFVPGINSTGVREVFKNNLDDILMSLKIAISKKLPREDYRELLDLSIIYLGGVPPGGIKFRKPGAYHMARWMAKAIYTLKLYLFRTEFKLSKLEENSLFQITSFIVKCYVIYWIYAVEAASAPLNDIKFLRELKKYEEIDKNVSEVAISKFINHLYYLTEECAAFALFDESIDVNTKVMMAKNINEQINIDEPEVHAKKLNLKMSEITTFLSKPDKEILVSLLSQKSANIFQRFKIENFLHIHPSEWFNSSAYQKGKTIIEQLRIVNDSAERGVKLVEDYNNSITRDETQKQFLLQVSNLNILKIYCTQNKLRFFLYYFRQSRTIDLRILKQQKMLWPLL